MRLRIRTDDGVPAFRAGQYFAIGLPVDGRFVQRPYSTASVPGESRDLEFLIRLVPGGSLTPSLWRLRPGDRVRVGPPKGLFTLEAGDPRRHLFLSTGTGIAPFLSMLGSLLGRPPAAAADRDPGGPPIVIHGVATVAGARPSRAARSAGRAPGRSSTSRRSRVRPTRPMPAGRDAPGGSTGSSTSIAERCSLEPAATVAYLCGNPAMIAAIEPRLVALGVPVDAIRAEQYWTPAARED